MPLQVQQRHAALRELRDKMNHRSAHFFREALASLAGGSG